MSASKYRFVSSSEPIKKAVTKKSAEAQAPPWPSATGTVFLSSEVALSATAINNAVRDGRIRKLAPNIYTADLGESSESLIRANQWQILAGLVQDAIVADRSALYDGMAVEGVLSVVSNLRSKSINLPGLKIACRQDEIKSEEVRPWFNGLKITNEARTLADNLALAYGASTTSTSKISKKQMLVIEEFEDWLYKKTSEKKSQWMMATFSDARAILVRKKQNHLIAQLDNLAQDMALAKKEKTANKSEGREVYTSFEIL